MRGTVSSGHPLTTEAACEMLRRGGNAFDAIVAAGFASSVSEPTLTTLGGGGFLLIHIGESKEDILFDFFVDTPGKGLNQHIKPELIPVELKFKSTVQVFHVGMGSVAVPGTLKGLIHCYSRLCSMDIEEIVQPALRYLNDGVEVSDIQAYLINILTPILRHSEYGREIFNLDKENRLFNPLLKEFISHLSPEKWLYIFNQQARGIEKKMINEGGRLTLQDILEYEVIERKPLIVPYREYELVTNPPPAFGGSLLKAALSYLEERKASAMNMEGVELLKVQAMEQMKRTKNGTGGTTHMSVIDEYGNAASMTASNGSNSGYFLGDTGIMLNNMMGEDDIHPEGFYSSPSGQRVRSMMSPSFLKKNSKIHSVLGSGGSKRIRTAILQVVMNLIDIKMDVKDAVEAPRVHLDDEEILQIEPGFGNEIISTLKKNYRVNIWKEKDMYFGGVHTAMGDLTGWGDSRRGGCFKRVD